ncbi:MAG: TIM44-like domain-containing protein [Victivallales bacterium]|nr:TIM44-like domain-containing protein [Victivallales bacterium]
MFLVLGLLLVLAGTVWWRRQGGDDRKSEVGAMAAPEGDDDPCRTIITAIRREDPDFEPERFLNHFETIFALVVRSGSASFPNAVRHLVSEGLFSQFSTMNGIRKHYGFAYCCREANLNSMKIAAFVTGAGFEAITVKVTAAMVECYENLDNGAWFDDGNEWHESTAYWTLVRRSGVRAEKGKSLADGRCPRCGALLTPAGRGRCDACRAVLNSGAYDWIVGDITSAEEWAIQGGRFITGDAVLPPLEDKIPIPWLEDRVRELFFAWAAARDGGEQELRRDWVTAAFRTAGCPPLQREEGGDGADSMFPDYLLLRVEMVAAETGSSRDRIRVRVKWRQDWWRWNPVDAMFINADESQFFNSEFILERRHGGGSRSDWKLAAIRPFSGYPPEWDTVFSAPHYDPDRDDVLAVMASLMRPDGDLTPPEQALLTQYAAGVNYDQIRLRQLILAVKRQTYEMSPLLHDRRRLTWLLNDIAKKSSCGKETVAALPWRRDRDESAVGADGDGRCGRTKTGEY